MASSEVGNWWLRGLEGCQRATCMVVRHPTVVTAGPIITYICSSYRSGMCDATANRM